MCTDRTEGMVKREPMAANTNTYIDVSGTHCIKRVREKEVPMLVMRKFYIN